MTNLINSEYSQGGREEFLYKYSLLLAGRGDKAKDLYETAQLEEKQFNKPHAIKLYRQVVEQYPNSSYASQAKNLLAEFENR